MTPGAATHSKIACAKDVEAMEERLLDLPDHLQRIAEADGRHCRCPKLLSNGT